MHNRLLTCPNFAGNVSEEAGDNNVAYVADNSQQ